MKLNIVAVLLGISVLVCPILYFLVGPEMTALQLSTLKTLLIICGCSAAYVFIVGELTRNNSQMDKLWSLLPAVYTWVIAARGGMSARLVVMACLATLWGARLTFNFARKGAYRLKFWEGEEDYRWAVLRGKKPFTNRFVWAVFDLLFISIYQNLLVLLTTLPALISMGSEKAFGAVDFAAAALMLFFIVFETVADEQQWRFHSEKKRLLREGGGLESLPLPFSRGFNTTGLWAHSRHPNYFAEQSIWFSLYIFSIGAGAGVVNWSLIGALLLVALFMGSSAFGEQISGSKYPLYAEYREKVSKFIPWFGTMDK